MATREKKINNAKLTARLKKAVKRIKSGQTLKKSKYVD